MKSYELTYIISSQLSPEEAEGVKNEIASFIQQKEGVIVRSEKIGAQPLSYQIKKQGSGYFNIETFQVEEPRIKEIKDSLDKNPKILRSFIVIKKPQKEMKERRTRRPLANKEFEVKTKPFIMDPAASKDQKEVAVDSADLEKKLDEMLSE